MCDNLVEAARGHFIRERVHQSMIALLGENRRELSRQVIMTLALCANGKNLAEIMR